MKRANTAAWLVISTTLKHWLIVIAWLENRGKCLVHYRSSVSELGHQNQGENVNKQCAAIGQYCLCLQNNTVKERFKCGISFLRFNKEQLCKQILVIFHDIQHTSLCFSLRVIRRTVQTWKYFRNEAAGSKWVYSKCWVNMLQGWPETIAHPLFSTLPEWNAFFIVQSSNQPNHILLIWYEHGSIGTFIKSQSCKCLIWC